MFNHKTAKILFELGKLGRNHKVAIALGRVVGVIILVVVFGNEKLRIERALPEPAARVQQVRELLRSLGQHLAQPPKVAVVFGGVSINPQMLALRGGADMVVAHKPSGAGGVLVGPGVVVPKAWAEAARGQQAKYAGNEGESKD